MTRVAFSVGSPPTDINTIAVGGEIVLVGDLNLNAGDIIVLFYDPRSFLGTILLPGPNFTIPVPAVIWSVHAL